MLGLSGCGAPSAPETGPAAAAPVSSSPTPADGPARPAVPARRAASALLAQRPVSVRLPSGRVVPVLAVSTRPDGELAVPEDIDAAGWWRGGSRLGDPFGSMLVAAHIDSVTQGLGPFAELLDVRPGARVRVLSASLRQDFRIVSRRLVPQGPLRGRGDISAPTGPARLTLVTCAPPYVRADGGYQNLAVVTAEPVGPPVRRGAR